MSIQVVRKAASHVKMSQEKRHILTSEYVLIIDTETSVDFAQHLKIAGFNLYHLQEHSSLAKGIVIDKTHLTSTELTTIQRYTREEELICIERQDFIKEFLYPLLFKGVPYANHNIKFDIGSLATSWDYPDKNTIRLALCDCTGFTGYNEEHLFCNEHPSIKVQHLPSGKFIFSIDTDTPIAPIIDTMQLGKALMGANVPGSLKGMGEIFKCGTIKFISEGHGLEIDEEYLGYTMNDVEATTELFEKEVELFQRYHIPIGMHNLISEASVGKGTFYAIGFKPMSETHTIEQWYERVAYKAYYGGRSEVMHRAKPVEVLYVDFMSEYPFSVSYLKLQELWLAKSLVFRHVTTKVTKLLQSFTLADMQRKNFGKELRIFVKIIPDNDLLPVRSKEEGDTTEVLRNTYIKSATPTWYTLLDVLASYVRTGKAPTILDAVEMIPYGRQSIKPINFFNQEQYHIDANREDFSAKLIDVRSDVKKDRDSYSRDDENYGNLDTLQNGLKLIANSTTYGMFCEMRELDGKEIAGKFACYGVGALITAMGRFLLALTETLGKHQGLEYVACDTDSMIFMKPDEISREEFRRRVQSIQNFFKPMSPFQSSNNILELEEVNGELPLYFIGISSKRYCCYHRLPDGTFHIRKATVNGVGFVQFDSYYDKMGNVLFEYPSDVPNPHKDKRYQSPKGVKPLQDWQYIMWYRAIQQFEKGITDVTIPIEQWSSQIVRNSVGLNSPYLMKTYGYQKEMRPFGFYTRIQGYDEKRNPTNYYIAGSSSSDEIEGAKVFSVETHQPVAMPHFKRLYEQFNDYFTYREKKVIDGNAIGFLQRKTIVIETIEEQTRKGKRNTEIQMIFELLEGA